MADPWRWWHPWSLAGDPDPLDVSPAQVEYLKRVFYSDAEMRGVERAVERRAYERRLGELRTVPSPAGDAKTPRCRCEWFVTVSPPLDVPVQPFVQKCVKYFSRSAVKWSEVAFEQKGETLATAGAHPHCHAVVSMTRPCYAAALAQQLRRAFNCVVQVTDVRDNTRGYIRGRKKALKMAATLVDPQWRAANNIVALYTHGAPPEYNADEP